jgi:hypothetical protein
MPWTNHSLPLDWKANGAGDDMWVGIRLHCQISGAHSGDRRSAIFWDVRPCILAVHRRFGGSYCIHLQGPRVSQASDQQKAGLASSSEAVGFSETSTDYTTSHPGRWQSCDLIQLSRPFTGSVRNCIHCAVMFVMHKVRYPRSDFTTQ